MTQTLEKKSLSLEERGLGAASKFFERQGYEILHENWECEAGSVDLIAKDEEALVFVEVNTRSSTEKGFPEEAITKDKRKRYEDIATAYLTDSYVGDIAVRFDVVTLLVVSPDRAFLKHHRNAFSVDG